MELKGTKTEKNLMAPLRANPRQGISTPILQALQRRKAMNR